MMERYYDAHLYLANWGTRRILLRLPRGLLDLDVVGDYCVDERVTAWTTSEFLVLDLTSEDESGDVDPDAGAPMSPVPPRTGHPQRGAARPGRTSPPRRRPARHRGPHERTVRLLLRVAENHTVTVRMEMLRRFHNGAHHKPARPTSPDRGRSSRGRGASPRRP